MSTRITKSKVKMAMMIVSKMKNVIGGSSVYSGRVETMNKTTEKMIVTKMKSPYARACSS